MPEVSFSHVQALGARMTYREMGTGRPILFQHGNPTSSYLWRDVMPEVAPLGRCLAVDLIGCGGSDKLTPSGPERYTIAEHARYLDAAWDALLGDAGEVILVLHDWGGALGLDWARRHADRVAGICYMETIVTPIATWDDWPENARAIFQALRGPAGEEMVLDRNMFVERILPASIQRDLTQEEMATYLAPFAEPGEARRPTLSFPRQIPIAGEPAEVVAMAQAYGDWMADNDLPKLFVNADPGSILTGPQRDFCRAWPNQQEVTVAGIHFIQEDSGPEIGRAIAAWIESAL